jgi:hypothetical protein
MLAVTICIIFLSSLSFFPLVFLSFSLSLYLFFSLSLFLSVSFSLCLFFSLSLCLSVSLSLCLFVSLSLYLSISLSLCLFVLSVSLSLFLYFDNLLSSNISCMCYNSPSFTILILDIFLVLSIFFFELCQFFASVFVSFSTDLHFLLKKTLKDSRLLFSQLQEGSESP